MKRRYLCAVPESAAAALLLAALTAPPALAAEPLRGHSPQNRAAALQNRARAQLELGLTSIPSSVNSAKSVVTIKGQITNRTSQALTGLTVRLRFRGTPLLSRGELAQFAATAAPVLPGIAASGPVTSLQNGAKQEWTLKARATALQMRSFGVYPIAVEVVNTITGVQLATRGTTLVFSGGAPTPKPTKVAWVWPVVDRPHRATDTVFLDDRLETSLSSGRLAGLVGAASKSSVPLTWAIDPALLDDAQAMTDGYVLRTARSGAPVQRAEQPASATARRWLTELRTARGNEAYFTLPYADPDPVALVRAKMNRQLTSAYTHMELTAPKAPSLKDLMGGPATHSIAWPPAGVADQNTLDRMARLNSRTFLLSGQFLPGGDQRVTPNATTTVKTAKDVQKAIVYDPTLTTVISDRFKTPGAALLAEQRFLAETAMITAEQPSVSRSLVIAPDRRWNPPAGFAQRLLKFTESAKWLKPVGLQQIISARAEPRAFTGYPEDLKRDELQAGYLKAVRVVSGKASRFNTIFNPPTNAYERTALRTESSYWRDMPQTAVRVRKAIDAELDRDIANIRIVPRRSLGMAGKTGKMPVTIANEFPSGKVTVRVRVTSKTRARLRVGTPNKTQVTLGPKDLEQLEVPLQAYANGSTDVVVELLTPGGKPIGEPSEVIVRTTGYGQTALLITGGGLAVLFLGVGMRVARAKRRDKTEGTSDGEPAGEQPPADQAAAGAAGHDGPEPHFGTTWTTHPDGSDESDRADGDQDSPVPSTSGTDAGSTGNNPA